jgi:hypothetical protein
MINVHYVIIFFHFFINFSTSAISASVGFFSDGILQNQKKGFLDYDFQALWMVQTLKTHKLIFRLRTSKTKSINSILILQDQVRSAGI